MKICFVLPFDGIAGGIFIVYEHARRLMEKGHDVAIAFARRTARIASYPGMDRVPTRWLGDIADDEEFDIACATWWKTAYALPRIRARNYCYLVQGFEDRFYPPEDARARLLVRKTYEEHLHLFTVSRSLSDYLRDEFGRESIVVRPAINFEWFRDVAPRIPRMGGRVRVLVEGSAAYACKRIPLAFAVLAEVPEAETIYLTPDGRGHPHWRIDHAFAKVPYREVPSIYASCDILLKLSSEESFALPVLETFASGGTAVVSAFRGHAEYIRHGHNALVVPVGDRESAVRALRQLVADRRLREALQANAKGTCDEFSWDESSARLEASLESLPQLPPLRVLPRLRRDFAQYQALGRIRQLRDLARRTLERALGGGRKRRRGTAASTRS